MLRRAQVEDAAPGDSSQPSCALSLMIHARDEDGKAASMDELKDQILLQLFAGAYFQLQCALYLHLSSRPDCTSFYYTCRTLYLTLAVREGLHSRALREALRRKNCSKLVRALAVPCWPNAHTATDCAGGVCQATRRRGTR